MILQYNAHLSPSLLLGVAHSPARVYLHSPSDNSMLATTDSGSIPSSNDSQLYKSINRLFSSTYVRDPRFPSPPRHHSPDALPQIRIPPLHPYVRPAILNPYDDITSAKHHSAHLINPMSSFISDLHLALERLSDPTPPPGEREAYGFQHSTPEFENQRDLSGLYRPRYTNVPSGSYASSPQEQQEKDDEEEKLELKLWRNWKNRYRRTRVKKFLRIRILRILLLLRRQTLPIHQERMEEEVRRDLREKVNRMDWI